MVYVSTRLIATILWGGMLVAFCFSAQAQSNTDAVSVATQVSYTTHPDFVLKQWTVADGLPSNAINAMVMLSDGYLYLATFDGLVRFDGLKFTTFNTANSPGLTSNRLVELTEDKQGVLWIRSEQGDLVRYANGRFFPVVLPEGRMVDEAPSMAVEGDTLWIRTEEGLAYHHNEQVNYYRPDVINQTVKRHVKGLAQERWLILRDDLLMRIDAEGQVQVFSEADGLPDATLMNLHVDPFGVLWVGTTEGVWTYAEERFEFLQPQPTSLNIGMWQNDKTNTTWLHGGGIEGAGMGWWGYRNGRLTRFPVVEEGVALEAALYDKKGHLWRIEFPWLYRDTIPVLRLEAMRAFIKDQEDNIWIGTDGNGLFRVKEAPLRMVGNGGNMYPILQDQQQRIWMGDWGRGLVHVENDTLTTYDLRTAQVSNYITSLYEDRHGRLWVGNVGLLCQMQGTRCVPPIAELGYTPYRSVRAILEDRHGRFWVGSQFGLTVGNPTGEEREHFTTETGLSHNWVRVIIESKEGSIFFGTNGGGVMRYQSGDTFEALTTHEGLASDNIRDLYEDEDGILWVATEDQGLCRVTSHAQALFAQAEVQCFDQRHGLFDNGLHRILPDGQGRFWFNTNRGIFWVERIALEALAAGTRASITSVSYTERDGLRNREGNGGVQPAGIVAHNGDLWFPTQEGAAVLNPEEVASRKPPKVVIEAIRVAGEQKTVYEQAILLSSQRDIEIVYTGLFFSRPEDVRFRYRLVGYEEEWNEVGARRVATYTNLPARDLRFEVVAGLGGAWSTPATFSFKRTPHLVERPLFYTLLLLGLTALGWGGYRYRLRHMERRAMDLERIVEERTAQLRSHQAELQKQTEELQQANELKSRFLTNITHEFRTPLTLTLGPLEDFLDDPQDPYREIHQRMYRNAQRLLRLINQLLDLSRLEAGALTLAPQRVDLVALLRQYIALFASLAEAQGIQFSFQKAVKRCVYPIDVQHFEKVVLNVLSNAFKFTPKGGAITVTLTTDEDEEVTLRISDTGIGIKADYLPHVFDRFYQVDGATTRQHEGSGIGLALAKEIVELHGGTITVQSTVGIGTTLLVTLPPVAQLDKAQEETISADEAFTSEEAESVLTAWAAEHNPSPTNLSNGYGDRVLVVDDNADMRTYIRTHLEKQFQVVEAANGVAGLEQARTHVPDLILSDIMMPHMDGLQFVEALRADRETSHIPIVFLTAKADIEAKLRGLESGADAYLAKPFNAKELRARVRHLIDRQRHLQEAYQQAAFTLKASPSALPAQEVVFLEQVRTVIEEHLARPEFNVGELAHAVGLSPRHLLRKLKALLGEKPNAVIRRMRLEHAQHMLLQQTGSVKEIAYAVGFRSVSHFTQVFQDAYGVSPTSYAEQHKHPSASHTM